MQADETAALDQDRAAWLSESLQAVSRTVIRYLFGPAARPLAYVRLKTLARRDIQLDLAVDSFLLNNGAPIGLADALERYGRPLPGQGTPLLRAAAGGAKSTASEITSVASLERAANALTAASAAAGNDNPYHDAQGRFTTAGGAVTPNPNSSPKSAPKGVRRTDHHVATVSSLKKQGFSQDVVNALEGLKVPAGASRGMPDHDYDAAHQAYNARENEITSQYADQAWANGQDPSTMTGEEAETFAKGLVDQINADPYCNTFNNMVGSGATTEELKSMLANSGALLQTKPTLTGGAEASTPTPAEASSASTQAGEPVTTEPAEASASMGETPEGVAPGSGGVSSAAGATLGVLNIVGATHDLLEAAAEEEDGWEGKLADDLAMRDLPPDKDPGILGRLHNALTNDPSPYYSPERLDQLNELRQNYRNQLRERRSSHRGIPSA